MIKSDAEQIVQYHMAEWGRAHGIQRGQAKDPSFSDFWRYLNEVAPGAAKFQSTLGSYEDIQIWFDEYFGQTWRR